jgi:hypothetical protein
MPSRNLVVVHLMDSDAGHSVDETRIGTLLWKAKIHPLRPIPSLSEAEIAALWQALREVLQGSTSPPPNPPSGG